MRILLATDGSRSADRARDLAASLPWPDASVVRVVAAIEMRSQIPGSPWIVPAAVELGELGELQRDVDRHVRDTLDDAERTLTRPGLTVERLILTGRPATAIVDEAREWGADIIVLGSRGHGPIGAMLLGSVSAEVVDHAPCPVLVVRRTDPGEVVFADDGSDGARHAAAVLTDWPVFHGLPVTVLTVANLSIPWAASPSPGVYDRLLETYLVDADLARSEVNRVASDAAAELRGLGIAAMSAVREGDPAHEILEFARERGASIIVLGTRGQTGLARLLLGSVARNVLLHAPCSVLVVREKAVVRPTGAEAEVTLVGSGR